MLGIIFGNESNNPRPLLSNRIPGYLVETHMGSGKGPLGDTWRYQANVTYLCPWTGETVGVWAGIFKANAFLEAVNQHHRVVFSLINRTGEDYERINRDTVISTPCRLGEMFGISALEYWDQSHRSKEAYEQMDKERAGRLGGNCELG